MPRTPPPVETCNGIDDGDGRTDEGVWCAVPAPAVDPPIDDQYGVHGSAADDVWAVGGTANLLHWDGSAWSRTRPGGSSSSSRNAVAGSGSADVWAVSTCVFDRWNGTSWPLLDAVWSFCGCAHFGLVAFSPSDAWGAGNCDWVSRWDGGTWNQIDLGGTESGWFEDVWGVSSAELWAVGRRARIIRRQE